MNISLIIPAEEKYSGNVARLTKHLENKLVRDAKTNQAKAAMQLAATAKRLFQGTRPEVRWGNLSQIRRCYLLCVTLDSIGGAIGMSTFLETYVTPVLDRAACANVEIRPLACIDIDTVEKMNQALAQTPLSKILERWYQMNPPMSMPLSAIRMPDLTPAHQDMPDAEWSKMFEELTAILFDEDTIRQASQAAPSPT